MDLLRLGEPGMETMDELSTGQHDFIMDAVREKGKQSLKPAGTMQLKKKTDYDMFQISH